MRRHGASLLVAAAALAMVVGAKAESYNKTFALEMAYMAAAAYCSEQAVLDWSCEACGSTRTFNTTMYLYSSDKNTAGFVGYFLDMEPKTAVVSFRGTLPSSLKDWIDDLDFIKTDYALCDGCEVHKGFWESYTSLRATTLEALDRLKPERVFVTGHSLGAAMAVFAAVDLKYKGYNVAAEYTFGQPRVGDSTFSTAYDTGGLGPDVSYRVVHWRDIVPHLPPEIAGFHHDATEVWYQSDNVQYQVCNGSGEDPNCSDSLDFPDSIDDHLNYMGIPISRDC